MTRPTGPDDPTYGGEGRYGVLTTGAPAWDGDLTALHPIDLDDRIASLGRHIGDLHTVYATDAVDGETWRAATAADLRDFELDRWVNARLAALRERTRRQAVARDAAEARIREATHG